MIRLVAQDDNGVEFLIETASVGGANVVLTDVPCEAAAQVSDFVRMNSVGTAVRAIADDFDNSNIIGVIESKSGSNLCNIRVSGVTDDLFTGLDVTKEYFLSDTVPGTITTTVPTTTGHVRLKVGQPFSATSFFVNKGDRLIRG